MNVDRRSWLRALTLGPGRWILGLEVAGGWRYCGALGLLAYYNGGSPRKARQGEELPDHGLTARNYESV